MIDIGWNDPFTLGQAMSLFIGWQIGKALLAYQEYRQYKKYYND